ncbi:MAG: SH3 domain-containing protein, partial [Planctomycetota bacterium]|nr:SH3 domain-containing protein [Planctomycetota bacterium]
RPEATTAHFPLGQRLKRGQRVRVIGRRDVQLPAAEDWFHIFSPTGVRGWVRAKQITVAGQPRAADWNAEWAAADAVNAVTVVQESALSKAAPQAPEVSQLDQTMSAAEALWITARQAQETGATDVDWAAVAAAHTAVVALDAEGAAGRLAAERILWIDAQKEVARLKLDLLEEHERRMAEAEALRDEMRRKSLARDPLWGRFRTRGWLERTQNAVGENLWRLIWGGTAVAEVTCSSGRYDLALFAGFEVGVMGATLSPATPSSPARIDVTGIEVISSRYR